MAFFKLAESTQAKEFWMNALYFIRLAARANLVGIQQRRSGERKTKAE
jgi:hypothetical protein